MREDRGQVGGTKLTLLRRLLRKVATRKRHEDARLARSAPAQARELAEWERFLRQYEAGRS